MEERLVHLAVIYVFMNGNPVPTLLVDTYYTIHSRHGKRWEVVCGTTLLYNWFMMHLPTRGPFVDTAKTSLWALRIMGLTYYDIVWHIMGILKEFITSCGEFPNVPLMGTKGCINYNPILARN